MGTEGIENDRESGRRPDARGEAAPAMPQGIPGEPGTPDEAAGRVTRDEAAGRVTSDGAAPDEAAGRASSDGAAGRVTSDEAAGRVTPPAVPEPRPGDWWRGDAVVTVFDDAATATGQVPGFVGGVEIPEILKPPPAEEDLDEEPQDEEAGAEAPEAEPRRLARLRAFPRFGSPLLLIAAALLLAGAALGSLVPLAVGWLIAYFSRERRGAVFVAPGLAVACGVGWLWGRVEGRWGPPVPVGSTGMGAAIGDTWPWTLRAAAVASALFLLWRARRRTP
ncbi:hypothetical protein ACIRSU_31590 [Streptomyces sp. NPDC101160]|uniref:hypothetical protein n=1 Tax=Streptomyces sp. NPDC101160 TaxID=3366118 RepID=UPI0037F9C474